MTKSPTIDQIFLSQPPAIYSKNRSEKLIFAHKLNFGPKMPDIHTIIGIEVEAENIIYMDPNITLGWWSIHDDSSLRNNGKEFKSFPMSCQYAFPALEFLFKYLNSNIDFSKRTSIHIHVNMRGLTISQLASIFITYVAVENLLFKFAGLHRRSNIYCVPISETDLLDSQPSDWEGILANLGNTWHKYSALNLLPLINMGTIEFRHLPGVSDVNKICQWVSLIVNLKLIGQKTAYKDLLNQITNLNTNSEYTQFVEYIFGIDSILLDMSNVKGLMQEPVKLLKMSMLNNDFHRIVRCFPNSSYGITRTKNTPKISKDSKPNITISDYAMQFTVPGA